MSLLKRREVVDKSGAGRDAGGRQYFEVYPAGSLRRWDLLQKGYKGSSDEAAKRRKKIFVGLSKVLPTAEIPKAYAKIDHAFDSLIASLTARAALSRTLWPDETQRKSAINEGWIHLPAGENVAACVK